MFSNIPILFALLALLIQVAVATPPACLLKAVNGPDSSPGNVKEVCGNGSNIKQALVSDCGSNFDAAMSAFSSICSGAGVTISTWDVASSPATLASSNSPGTSYAASSAMTTSAIKSDTTATSAPDSESATTSASSTEPVARSTRTAVTTATDSTAHITTHTTSQASNTSAAATSSGASSTGAAGRVEMSGMTMGAIAAAAGAMMAL